MEVSKMELENINTSELDFEGISIKKYRSFLDSKVILKNINIIVGRNDNGKTNLLRAIRAYLNPNYTFDESDRIVYKKVRRIEQAKISEIEITGLFSDNTSDKLKIIKNIDGYYYEDSKNTIQINNLPKYECIDIFDDYSKFLYKRYSEKTEDIVQKKWLLT